MMNSMQETMESVLSSRLQTVVEDGSAAKALLIRLEKELGDMKVLS